MTDTFDPYAMDADNDDADHPGDNRPAIYVEGDNVVYRASSLGNCIKELTGIRFGITPAPFPAKFRKAFDDGHRGEDVIINQLRARGFSVTRQQEEINWQILPGVILRGHIDGVAQYLNEPPRVMDAKTTSKRYGISPHLQQKYDLQLSIYGHALGLDSAMLAIGEKNAKTGDVEGDVVVENIDVLPVSVNQIKARIAKIEAGAKAMRSVADLPKCDTEQRYPCFPAGTFVLTEDGYRPIETIKVGDRVLTHKRCWMPVTDRQETPNALLREVRSMGVPSLRITDDHPVLTRERYTHHHKHGASALRKFYDAEWLTADKLERHHFVAQVLPPEVEDDHSTEFWWLVGRYLADGWMHDSGRATGVFICCAREEVDELAAGIAAAGYTAKRYDEDTVTKFRISGGQGFYDFVQQFGRYAHGKRLSGLALGLPSDKATALLEGYWSGDGHRRPNRWTAVTVSKELALGVCLLTQRIGRVSSAYLNKRAKTAVIQGRVVNQRDAYRLVTPDINVMAFIEDDVAWRQVRMSRPLDERATVFNLTVAEDNSYMAEGVLVHNCGLYQYHDDAEQPVTVRQSAEIDEIFDGVMSEYEAARDDEAAAKALKEDAKKRLVAHLGGKVPKSTGEWALDWTGSGIKKELDKKALEKFLKAHEKTLDEFYGTVSVEKSISVKRVGA